MVNDSKLPLILFILLMGTIVARKGFKLGLLKQNKLFKKSINQSSLFL